MAKELKDMTVAEAKASGQEQAYSNLVAGYGVGTPSSLVAPNTPTTPVIPVDSAMGSTPTLPKINNAPIQSQAMSTVQSSMAVPPPALTPEKVDTTARGTMETLATKLFGGNQDVTAQRQEIRAQQETAQKAELARSISNRYTLREREIQRQREELEKNPRGVVGQYAFNAQLSKFNRESERELADIAVQYNIANGDYLAAEKIVSERLSDIQAQRSQDIQAFQTLFNFVQNDMTESEKLQAQQAWQEKQSEKDFAQKKEIMTYEQTIRQGDPLYQAQLLKAQRDAMGGGAEAPKVVKINGVDSVWNPTTGEFEPVSVKGGGTGELVLASANQNIKNIEGILNSNYLSSAVGPNALARVSPLNKFTGGKDDFISKVDQIVSNLSLDTLIQAKEKGATFGALSDTEMKILASAATNIASKAVKTKDKDGNLVVTGYKGSEKAFKDEIQIITNMAKLDYLLKGGNLEDVGAVQMEDGTVWVTGYDNNLVKLR